MVNFKITIGCPDRNIYSYIYTRNSARFARRFLVPAEGYMLASLRSASGYPLPYIYMYTYAIELKYTLTHTKTHADTHTEINLDSICVYINMSIS